MKRRTFVSNISLFSIYTLFPFNLSSCKGQNPFNILEVFTSNIIEHYYLEQSQKFYNQTALKFVYIKNIESLFFEQKLYSENVFVCYENKEISKISLSITQDIMYLLKNYIQQEQGALVTTLKNIWGTQYSFTLKNQNFKVIINEDNLTENNHQLIIVSNLS